MKLQRTALWCSLLAATTVANADPITDAFKNGDTDLSLRYRYEMVDVDGMDKKANASTLKTRLTYKTAAFYDFMLLAEVDDVTILGNQNYQTPGGEAKYGAYPVVADPSGTEVNQIYLQYNGIKDTAIKWGRQRILLDGQRFVGGVGWRQNEQTYDAFSVVNKSIPDTTLTAAYIYNVNGITFKDDESSHILLNAKYDGFSFASLVGYAYLLDSDAAPAAATQTLGFSLNGGTAIAGEDKIVYAFEFANQSEYADNEDGFDANYLLLEAGYSSKAFTVKLGYELLGWDTTDSGAEKSFQTPLATKHKFNGWADMFLGTPNKGLEDVYLTASTNIAGTNLAATYHDFSSEEGDSYGQELDIVAAKKLTDNYSVLGKLASYSEDGYKKDTTKLWLQVMATY